MYEYSSQADSQLYYYKMWPQITDFHLYFYRDIKE